jgi:Leucine-rich repeat (LRR) protein
MESSRHWLSRNSPAVILTTILFFSASSIIPSQTLVLSLPTDSVDIQSLKDLYDSLNGSSWQWSNTSIYPAWNFSTPLNSTNPCDPIHWQRVMCTTSNDMNHISTILLSSFGLDGYLPSSVGNFVELSVLDLAINKIVGPIPPEIGSLTKLKILYISTNSFSNSIPSTLGNLRILDDMDIDNNHLTGTIPSEFGLLTSLRYLDMDNNFVTGTIPPEMQTLNNLIDLDLDKNRLTGTIPSALSRLSSLMYLSLDTNSLTGTIPSEIGAMTLLNVLLVQNNHLSGSVDSLLWQAANLSLTSLDISGNVFSGTIPSAIFLIPQINILSLSVNCFEGPLPDTICHATTASIIAMDSLSSASSCKHSWRLSFINRIFWKYFGGSYPTCITALPNLVVLHLSGNGLGGQLGVIPPYSKLRNMSLTHNRLTGTIPKSFQEWPFVQLDLSVNRLTGEFLSNISKAYSHATCFGEISPCIPRTGKISLTVNRISGTIPSEVYNAQRVDVLTGNTFSCGHLPPEDPVVNYYTCGSTLLDVAMACFGAVFVCLVLIALVVRLSTRLASPSPSLAENTSSLSSSLPNRVQVHPFWSLIRRVFLETCEYVNWNQHLMAFCLPNLQAFNDLLDQFLRGIIFLSLLGIILNIPTYALKFQEDGTEDANITTHMWMYRWVLSLVFVSGLFPAVMLILSWVLSVVLVGWILRTRLVKENSHSRDNDDDAITARDSAVSQRRDSLRLTTVTASVTVKEDRETTDSRRATLGNQEDSMPLMRSHVLRWGSLFLRALVNCAVVLTVHVIFVYLSATAEFTLGANLVAQFSLGAFMLAWNNVVVPELIIRSDPTMLVWDKLSIRVLMLLFNMIVVPCIATAFTRPSCFQYVLTPPEKISAEYSYSECGFAILNETSGEEQCVVPDDITIQLKPAEPPLIYNFQCGSELLTDYIPVYLYTYTFLLLLPIARYLWLWNIPIDSLPGDSSATLFVPSGIMFPDHWHSLPTYITSCEQQEEEEEQERAKEQPLHRSSNSFPSPMHITSADSRTQSAEPSSPPSSLSSPVDKKKREKERKRKRNPSKNNLWKPDSILSRLITHCAILLTFGVCSPVLSLAIVLAVVVSILEWKFVLGRFLFRRFSTILRHSPLDHPRSCSWARSESSLGLASALLVAVDSVSGYCDVNGEEGKHGVDFTFVCLEDSLTGILFSTGRCLIMTVRLLSLPLTN